MNFMTFLGNDILINVILVSVKGDDIFNSSIAPKYACTTKLQPSRKPNVFKKQSSLSLFYLPKIIT